MGATIHVNEDIKDRLKLLARTGETDDEVLQRLIRYVEEMDLEERPSGGAMSSAVRLKIS